MIILFVVYLILILGGGGVSFVKKRENVLSYDQTNALKGIGIMTVFFNHLYNDYLTPHGVLHHPYWDEPFVYFESLVTVLFVGVFLFFSGYGVFESVKKKGIDYVNKMPVKRVVTTLFNFDIAVFVFLVFSLLLKICYSPTHIILSFIGWESIGNSNWYIFAILCCYLTSYVSLKICSSRITAIILTFFLITIYYALMVVYKYPWWHNTIFCYPFGMLYSQYQEKINSFFYKNYLMSSIIALVVFVVFFRFSSNAVFCNIGVIAFSFSCILLSMKVQFNGKALIWFGTHLFTLYIYQRLPMYIIDHAYPELITNTPLLFVLICMSVTLLIGWLVPVFKFGR